MMKISYKKLMRYLMSEHDYTEAEAAHSIDRLRDVHEEIKEALAEFWQTGEVPNKVHGMNVPALMKHRDMDPIAALLAIDWLIEQPRAAKWAMMHPRAAAVITKQDIEYLERIAAENGWDLDGGPIEHSTEDLEV